MKCKGTDALKNSIFLLGCLVLVKYTNKLHDQDFLLEVFVLSLSLRERGCFSGSFTLQFTGWNHFPQRSFYRTQTQRRTLLPDILPVRPLGFLLYQLPDSCIGGNNPFNGIGCLCTLDLCDFNQFLQFIRALLQVKLLLTGLFIDCSNKPKDLRIPFLIAE